MNSGDIRRWRAPQTRLPGYAWFSGVACRACFVGLVSLGGLAGSLYLGCAGATSGSGASGSAGGTLAGIWDVTGAAPGSAPTTGTIEITPTRFALAFADTTLAFDTQGSAATLTYVSGDETHTTPEQHTPGALNTGTFPFPLGGTWTIASDTGKERCNLTFNTSTALGNCTEVNMPGRSVPDIAAGVYTGQRTRAASSIFGDLGGSWTFTSGEARGSCTATFEGAIVIFSCANAKRDLNGTVTARVDGNVVSGNLSSGVEFSARRR